MNVNALKDRAVYLKPHEIRANIIFRPMGMTLYKHLRYSRIKTA